MKNHSIIQKKFIIRIENTDITSHRFPQMKLPFCIVYKEESPKIERDTWTNGFLMLFIYIFFSFPRVFSMNSEIALQYVQKIIQGRILVAQPMHREEKKSSVFRRNFRVPLLEQWNAYLWLVLFPTQLRVQLVLCSEWRQPHKHVKTHGKVNDT